MQPKPFTPEFEQRLLVYLLQTPKLLLQHRSHMSNTFADPVVSNIINPTLGIIEESGSIPGKEVIGTLLYEYCRKDEVAALNYDASKELLDLAYSWEPDDDACTKQVFLDYVKERQIEQLSLQFAGQYESVEDKLDAIRKGLSRIDTLGDADEDLGTLFFTNLKEHGERLKVCLESTVPTGIPLLDQNIKGGLSKGCVGNIVGIAKHGKSMALQGLGIHAASLGKLVVIYELEMSEEERLERSIAQMAQHNINSVVKDYGDDMIKKLVNKDAGRGKETLIIKAFPSVTKRVSDLAAHIDKIVATMGRVPSLVIIDQLPCLLPSRKFNADYAGYIHIAREMKAMAAEYGLAIWTAMQINRGGAKKGEQDEERTLTKADIGDAYGVITVFDVNITLNRSESERKSNRMRYFIESNRRGKDRIHIHMDINTDLMTIKQARNQDFFKREASPTQAAANIAAKLKGTKMLGG